MLADADRVYLGERLHLASFWPDRSVEEYAWTLGPAARRWPRFRVRRIAPKDQTELWIYVTVGAWEATAELGQGLEFFVLSPIAWPLHVELLTMVMYLHADTRYRLDVGGVIDIGRPWLEGSQLHHLLVSLPYPYGPSLECCNLDGFHTRFLWLLPITEAEARLAQLEGLEALEQRLEAAEGLNVADPLRASVV